MPEFYHQNSLNPKIADRDTVFLISHKLTGSWQIIDSNTGCVYTPQAYEATFGFLPPCPPSANKKTRKEWTAHRKQNPAKGRGNDRGFG